MNLNKAEGTPVAQTQKLYIAKTISQEDAAAGYKMYCYAWSDNNKNAAWPGEAMTAEDYKHGLYSYEVSDKYDTIIFHANAGESDPTKTSNLTIDRTNVYYSQHNNVWKSKLEDCTFAYYLIGSFNSWGENKYENGLLKNFAGGNTAEYMKVDYQFKKDDEFKVVDEGKENWYGTGKSEANGNYLVHMNNSGNATAFVYFNSTTTKLYAGTNFYYNANGTSYGYKFWCHHWYDATGAGTSWPGTPMTRDDDSDSYWYYAMVDVSCNSIIFNNQGDGGSGNLKTADLKNIDAAKPYYDGGWKASK